MMALVAVTLLLQYLAPRIWTSVLYNQAAAAVQLSSDLVKLDL